MDTFKKTLKIAITEKVDFVRFEPNQAPFITTGNDSRQLTGLTGYSEPGLKELIEMMLPDFHGEDGILSGELSIVGFGDLQLYATTGKLPILTVMIPPIAPTIRQEVLSYMRQIGDEKKAPKSLDISNFSQHDEFIPDIAIPEVPHQADPTEDLEVDREGLDHQDNHSRDSEAPFDNEDEENDLEFTPSHLIKGEPIDESESDDQMTEMDEGNATQIIHEASELPYESGQFTYAGGHPGDDQQSDLSSESVIDDTQQSGIIPTDEPGESSADVFLKPSHPLMNGRLEDLHSQDEDIHQNLRNEMDEADYSSNERPIPHAESISPNPHTNSNEENKRQRKIYFGSAIPGETIQESDQPRLIDGLLHTMVENNASDLHLTLGKVASFRIDGEIIQVATEIINESSMKDLLLPIVPPRNEQEFIEKNDTDFAYELAGLGRFRVNLFRDMNGVGAVLRHIPDQILSADQLDLPRAVRRLCSYSKGLVLVTGPTGSGKSTTLAAMIDLINATRSEHIITIEDPIEFVHEPKKCLVRQREVGRHTSSFSSGLRAALREDPDIILVGEMRDLETISMAIQTAETGHLVLGTLHTNTAISTIDRLIDQFPPDQQEQVRIMLAESLRGVISQTLVKKKNGGRIAAHEILMVDKAVSNLIRESNLHLILNHMQTQKSKGNQLLNDHLIDLVSKNIIDAEQAYYRAVEKDSILKALQQRGLASNLSEAS